MTTTHEDRDIELGELLRELRQRRRLSVKRLAALSGVSRRTIGNAETGANITVAILRKLLRSMGIAEITLRVDGTHTVETSTGVSPVDVRVVAEAVRKASSLLQAAAQRLEGGAVRAPRDVSHRAETLIASFSTFVRGVADVGELDRLQESVASLCAAERRPARRRAVTTTRRRSG